MKTNMFEIGCALAVMSIFFNTSWASEYVINKEVASKAERIELVEMPLSDAIRNLARQASLNCILDPRVVGSPGIFHKEPSVTKEWKNVTAEEALQSVLKQYKLTMVHNPATTVARIVPKNVVARAVPMSELASDETKPVPLIKIDDVPLSDAIQNLARYIGLKVTVAPETKQEMDRRFTVTVRWENITPRQALAALMDNYDLILIQGEGGSAARVTLKTKAGNK